MSENEKAKFPTPLMNSIEILIVEKLADAEALIIDGYPAIHADAVVMMSDESLKKVLIQDDAYLLFYPGGKALRALRGIRSRLNDIGYTGGIHTVKLNKGRTPADLVHDAESEVIRDMMEKAKDRKTSRPLPLKPKERPAIKAPFYFVGWNESGYYVMPKNQSISIAIGRTDNSIKNMLCDIAPRRWWLSHFSHEGKIDYDSALEWFRHHGQKKGIYDPELILGPGAHFDEGKIVVNTGKNVYQDGKTAEYENYQGATLFRRSKLFFDISGRAWDDRQGYEFFQELLNYGFSSPLEYILLAGWIALAPFASLLDRRPHIAIIGKKGCGKTTLIKNIVTPAIGSMGIFCEGDASEAGIRQLIGSDCRPAIIDEFESHTKEAARKKQAVLALARSAYSGESATPKGTTGGTPLVFKTKVMFMFLAINIYFDNDADRTRIPIISMFKSENQIGRTFDFSGLRKRTLDTFPRIKKNIALCKKYIAKTIGGDSRLGDTNAPLIAGCWSMISDAPFLQGEDGQNKYFMEAIATLIMPTEQPQDEEILLSTIFSHIVHVGIDDEQTVAEMIENINIADNHPWADKRLRQIGIRRDPGLKIRGGVYDVLAIAEKGKYIQDTLKDSPFQGDYKNILARHPAAFKKSEWLSMGGGVRVKCIILDWKKLKELHFGGY